MMTTDGSSKKDVKKGSLPPSTRVMTLCMSPNYIYSLSHQERCILRFKEQAHACFDQKLGQLCQKYRFGSGIGIDIKLGNYIHEYFEDVRSMFTAATKAHRDICEKLNEWHTFDVTVAQVYDKDKIEVPLEIRLKSDLSAMDGKQVNQYVIVKHIIDKFDEIEEIMSNEFSILITSIAHAFKKYGGSITPLHSYIYFTQERYLKSMLRLLLAQESIITVAYKSDSKVKRLFSLWGQNSYSFKYNFVYDKAQATFYNAIERKIRDIGMNNGDDSARIMTLLVTVVI